MRVLSRLIRNFSIFLLIFTGLFFTVSRQNSPFQTPHAKAAIDDASGLLVGTTYYGGNYDESTGKWIIDNKNQCDRIKSGEFTASSLDAVVNPTCSDDNGLGYMDDIPLHNSVSYAELSNDASNPDYAALGGLPAGTKLEIKYNDKCVIAEKRDEGDGGDAVDGVHRSLDLWWQTARAIGFTNGWDVMTIRLVDSSTPLSPLGGTSECGTGKPTISAQPVVQTPATTTTQSTTNTKQEVNESTEDKIPEETTVQNAQLSVQSKTNKTPPVVLSAVKAAKKNKTPEPIISNTSPLQNELSRTFHAGSRFTIVALSSMSVILLASFAMIMRRHIRHVRRSMFTIRKFIYV
ncbi:MAG TPA: hypothetical protein PKD20_00330 [Candidatus Saccharibacteria bacterium]|nr:hypothetical protein [Candidatus Saccharibacteria bacterium]HMT55303.1 hypothetical protein [Candidatus Saccharibacteria bacterium]